jgi:hypothetical protein
MIKTIERIKEKTVTTLDLFFSIFGWNENITIFLSADLATRNQQVINMTR